VYSNSKWREIREVRRRQTSHPAGSKRDFVVVPVCQCLDQWVSTILGVLEILDVDSSWTS